MNRFLQTLIVAAPMVIAAPYVAAETHPAQRRGHNQSLKKTVHDDIHPK